MKVFVAAKWEDRTAAQDLMSHMKILGLTISYDWTQNDQVSRETALADFDGVMNADALVFWAPLDLGFRGAYVEMGIALALDLPVYLMGPGADECIYIHHPNVTRDLTPLLDAASSTPSDVADPAWYGHGLSNQFD